MKKKFRIFLALSFAVAMSCGTFTASAVGNVPNNDLLLNEEAPIHTEDADIELLKQYMSDNGYVFQNAIVDQQKQIQFEEGLTSWDILIQYIKGEPNPDYEVKISSESININIAGYEAEQNEINNRPPRRTRLDSYIVNAPFNMWYDFSGSYHVNSRPNSIITVSAVVNTDGTWSYYITDPLGVTVSSSTVNNDYNNSRNRVLYTGKNNLTGSYRVLFLVSGNRRQANCNLSIYTSAW